jgi:beta-glucosidase
MTGYQPLRFPENFLWGVATAAHQNEGNNTNNDFWQWEQMPGKVTDNTTSGLTCNWWDPDQKRAEADFERAAEMGLKAMRLSVEWSRIEPEPGKWDKTAIERYRSMLKYLHQLGITPMLTLHHFTNPFWLAERGGWLAAGVVGLFFRYTNYVVQKLGDLCNVWCTINEPMVYAYMAYLTGQWSPGEKNFLSTFQIAATMAKAHIAAVEAIHFRQPQAKVGLVNHIPVLDPVRPNKLEQIVANWQDTLFNRRILEAVYQGQWRFPLRFNLSKNHPLTHFASYPCTDDFIGINYYGRHSVAFDPTRPFTLFGRHEIKREAEMWQAPWADREIYPRGLYQVIKQMAAYNKPIYITENGLADREDARRPKFLLTHLAAVHRAIQEGIDVRGYYHWTLVDNYEWVEGWSTRFGLIELDPETQKRAPRRSAQLYSDIIKVKAITPEIVEEYAPEAMEAVFRND